jgi:hypothetical protein
MTFGTIFVLQEAFKKCTLARSQPGDLKFNIFVDT